MTTNNNYNNGGKILRDLRTDKGLSILKVAREIGVSGNYISLIERGKRQPSRAVLTSLADFYGFDPHDLYVYYEITPTEFDDLIRNESMRKVLTRMSTDKRLSDDDITNISKKLHDILTKEDEK